MKIIIFFIALLLSIGTNGQIITTHVGTGILNDLDVGDGGLATKADIAYPEGLSFDNSGNLLACEYDYVRQISRTGIITTIAGSDTASACCGIVRNGVPATTVLLGPMAVCVDKLGNYYIADEGSGEIRIVEKNTGMINAFAGNGMVGNNGDDGPATSASFNTINSLCIDTLRGCIYISDEFNYRIRKVDMSTHIITAYAGTGTNGYSNDGQPATTANFSRVLGLSLDHSGNLYICDWDNARIRKVTLSTGIVTTFAGNGISGYFGDNGPATNAMISKSSGLCFDNCGNMFFSDENNARIRRIDAVTNIITTVAGTGAPGFSGDGGASISAKFNHPTGICANPDGSLYVSDYNNQRIRRIIFDTLCNGMPSRVSVSTLQENTIVTIYPNPTYNLLNIDNLKANSTYRLLSMVGATMQQGSLNKGSNSISIQAIPTGLYLLEIIDEEGKRSISKVVKE